MLRANMKQGITICLRCQHLCRGDVLQLGDDACQLALTPVHFQPHTFCYFVQSLSHQAGSAQSQAALSRPGLEPPQPSG